MAVCMYVGACACGCMRVWLCCAYVAVCAWLCMHASSQVVTQLHTLLLRWWIYFSAINILIYFIAKLASMFCEGLVLITNFVSMVVYRASIKSSSGKKMIHLRKHPVC